MTTDRRPLVNASVEVDETDGRMTAEKALIDLGGASLGTGLPTVKTFADPASDGYTAAQAVTTARTRIRCIVGTSGMVVSLDGGTTDHLAVLPNTDIELGIAIGAAAMIAVKRYTAGTPFDHARVEVR